MAREKEEGRNGRVSQGTLHPSFPLHPAVLSPSPPTYLPSAMYAASPPWMALTASSPSGVSGHSMRGLTSVVPERSPHTLSESTGGRGGSEAAAAESLGSLMPAREGYGHTRERDMDIPYEAGHTGVGGGIGGAGEHACVRWCVTYKWRHAGGKRALQVYVQCKGQDPLH